MYKNIKVLAIVLINLKFIASCSEECDSENFQVTVKVTQ